MLALAGFLLIALGPLAVRAGVVSANAGFGAVALGALLATVALAAAAATVVRTRRPPTSPVLVLAALALVVPAWTVLRAWSAPGASAGDAGVGVLILTGDPLETFGRAGRAAQEAGWTIVRVDEAGGRIEAADTSRWFHLTDDIEIRVRPEGDRDQVRVELHVTPRASLAAPWRRLLKLGDDGVDPRRTADYVRRLASLR